MKHFLLVFAVVALFASCKKKFDPIPFPPDLSLDHSTDIDESHLPAHIKQNYKLSWNDEFNGNFLNRSRWMYRLDGSLRTIGWLNKNNVSLSGVGQLVIEATKGTDGKYYTGMVATEGLFEQKYGYFECRAKMHKGKAVHSAFWIHSRTFGATLDYKKDGVEIDVMEYLRSYTNGTDLSKKYQINLHWDGYGANHKTAGTTVDGAALGIDFGDDSYHTFAVEWTENEYVFYADGKETWRTSQAVSEREQSLFFHQRL